MRLTVAFMLLWSFGSVTAGEGHREGYDWADRQGLDDPDSCYSRSGGYISNSRSFTEGCLEYFEERQTDWREGEDEY